MSLSVPGRVSAGLGRNDLFIVSLEFRYGAGDPDFGRRPLVGLASPNLGTLLFGEPDFDTVVFHDMKDHAEPHVAPERVRTVLRADDDSYIHYGIK